MEPIQFKECNVIYGKDQHEYRNLPALKLEEHGTVVTCWRISWKERLRLLITGKMWIGIMTYNEPLMPLMASTKMSDIVVLEKTSMPWGIWLVKRIRKNVSLHRCSNKEEVDNNRDA